jgi:hypothetical protein
MIPAEGFVKKNNGHDAAKNRHQMNKETGAVRANQFDSTIVTEV